jgi:very-short-patch-repair endonuclease
MRDRDATDHLIARLAERQGGVVEHGQLVALGLSPQGIHTRVRAGQLHRWYRGVYAVGHRNVRAEGRRWAAILAYSPDGVLSHSTAGVAWGLLRSNAATIDVTVGLGGRSARPSIRLHRTRSLPADEVTTLDGLPITTPARTLLDLAAAGLSDRALEAALDAADVTRVLDFKELRELVARHRGRRGTPSLDAQLSRYGGPVDTRSRLERLVYELCDDHRLPRPLVNTVIQGKVRDFYWPHCRLVVEADSYRWHRSPSALNDDRERDVLLTLAGYRVLRFTWEQVTERPRYVVHAIRTALLRVDAA